MYQKLPSYNPFGLLKFLWMPFGLKNAAQTFQQFMNQVLRGLHFTYNYLDDLLIASPDAEEQKKHLRLVFKRLQRHGSIDLPSQMCAWS